MSSVLDGIGVKLDLGPDDLVASAVLVVRIIQEDGREFVGHYSSDGMSFIEKVGLLRVAERMTLSHIDDVPDGDDD